MQVAFVEQAGAVLVACISLLGAWAWPLLVGLLVFWFRADIRRLLGEVSMVRHGDTEVHFRNEAVTAMGQPEGVEEAPMEIEPDGFAALSEIEAYLVDRQLSDGEQIERRMLLNQTPTQRTWLIRTNGRVLVLVDDEATRTARSWLQGEFPPKRVLRDLAARELDALQGEVTLSGRDWYYSRAIYATPGDVESAVRKLVGS